MKVHGVYAPEFEPVVDVFEANFVERGDLGASFCLVQDGVVKVDIWGGSTSIVDFDERLAFSYVMNRIEPGVVGDPRGALLGLAVYESLARL